MTDLQLAPKMRGFFTLIATNADTGEQRVLAEFENLLLDGGINNMGGTPMLPNVYVGSGSTAPINTNSALEHLIAGTPLSTTDHGGDPSGYGWLRVTYNFNVGVAAGNLSEVGVGASATNLLSRSLIKDGTGSPTSITVLSNEYFTVVYELRLYPPTADSSFHATIDGVDTTCTLRAAEAGTTQWSPWGALNGCSGGSSTNNGSTVYDGDIGAVTGTPSGSSYQAGNSVYGVYVNNALNIDMQTALIPVNQANFSGGIKSMLFRTSMGSYQVSFNPTINKTSSKTMQLTMRFSWTRNS